MSIKESAVNQIASLAHAASLLAVVTGSDTASNNILRQIEELAEGEPVKTNGGGRSVINEEASARAEADLHINEKAAERPLTAIEQWGKFATLVLNPQVSMKELDEAAKKLGYRGVAVVLR